MVNLQNFKYTTAKKPGDTNGRVQFSTDGTNYVNKEGDSLAQGAYIFDGIDDKITVSDDATLDFEYNLPFSYMGWFRTVNTGASTEFVMSKQESSGDFRGWGYVFSSADNGELRTTMQNSGSNSLDLKTSMTLGDGEWHHIAYTYDGSQDESGAKIYIDGVEDTARTAPNNSLSATIANSVDLTYAARQAALYFDGDLGEHFYYSEELSATDVWNYFAYGINPDATNLEAHHKFNGNALDETANNNDGTVSGAVNTTDWTDLPHIGHSFLTDAEAEVAKFDGVDDWVDTNDGDDLEMHLSDMSVSAWFKTPNTSSAHGLAGKFKSAAIGGRYGLYMSSAAPGKIRGLFDALGSGSSTVITDSTTDIDDDKWHHALVTFDRSGLMSLYVDDVLEDTASISGYSATDGDLGLDFAIGQYWSSSSTPALFFEGEIANVTVWKRVLSAAEVTEVYQQGWVDVNDANISSYWPLAGDYADKAGSNNGTNNGTVFIKDLLRPQPEEPVQQSIDISALGDQETFVYRTFFEGPNDRTFALDEITLEYLIDSGRVILMRRRF